MMQIAGCEWEEEMVTGRFSKALGGEHPSSLFWCQLYEYICILKFLKYYTLGMYSYYIFQSCVKQEKINNEN